MSARRLVAGGTFLVFAILSAGALFWMYAPAIAGPYVWDDHTLIEQDPRVTGWARGHASVSTIFAPFWPHGSWSEPVTLYFRPLVTLSYGMNALFSERPSAFHTTNVVLHLLTMWLVVILARREGARPLAAMIAALAWGCLPRLAEAVAWIAGRTDTMAAMLGLSAMIVWPLAADATSLATRRRIASSLLIVLALLCKEVAFAVPCALLAADFASSPRPRIARALAPVAGVVAYGALRFVSMQHAPSPPDPAHAPLLLTPLEAIGRYVQMIVTPLRPEMPIGMRGEPNLPMVVLGGAVVAIALVLAVRLVSKLRAGEMRLDPITVRWSALAIVSIAPALQIVPLRIGGAVVADRFLYLPLAALAILLARAASSLSLRSACGLAVAALVFVGVEGAGTRARAALFGDEVELWMTAAEDAHPHNTLPLANLAALPAMDERDDLKLVATRRVSAVLESTGRTATTTYRRAQANEIAALDATGAYAAAQTMARSLAVHFPDSAIVQAELGYAEIHSGDFVAAREAFNRALVLDPSFRDAQRMRDIAEGFVTSGADANAPRATYGFLAAIGRKIEACAAARAVAEGTVTPIDWDEYHALDFLVTHDDVHRARTALDRMAPRLLAGDAPAGVTLDRSLRVREAQRAEVDRIAVPLQALVEGPI